MVIVHSTIFAIDKKNVVYKRAHVLKLVYTKEAFGHVNFFVTQFLVNQIQNFGSRSIMVKCTNVICFGDPD